MKGTAVLIEEDQTVTILEDINSKDYKKLTKQTDNPKKMCTTTNDNHIVWCDHMIDLEYGY